MLIQDEGRMPRNGDALFPNNALCSLFSANAVHELGLC